MWSKKSVFFIFLLTIGFVFLHNEFFVYYLVLGRCKWPAQIQDGSVKAMLLADTHLLGPHKGHWFDKLRREWQMRRAFQSAIWLHQPDVVFILGDIFDEGQWVNDKHFEAYLLRFYDMFRTPNNVEVFSAVGNHDVGFHYRLHPYISERFRTAFNESNNSLITIKNAHFILLNSMTLSRDGCFFCAAAEAEIRHISNRLKCTKQPNLKGCEHVTDKLPFYAKPILLQHFPMFRESDKSCIETDIPEIELYRENWEVLSRNATEFLQKRLNPSVAFSGHSHHYCRLNHSWGVEEFTIASFSWRNKQSPSFLLAEFSNNNYAVSKCDMPKETTVFTIYFVCAAITIAYAIYLLSCAFLLYCRKPKAKEREKKL